MAGMGTYRLSLERDVPCRVTCKRKLSRLLLGCVRELIKVRVMFFTNIYIVCAPTGLTHCINHL